MSLQDQEQLRDDLHGLQLAMQALHGTLSHIQAEDVEQAIAEMEAAVDRRLAPYAGNDMVAGLAEKAKAEFRQHLLTRAAAR